MVPPLCVVDWEVLRDVDDNECMVQVCCVV